MKSPLPSRVVVVAVLFFATLLLWTRNGAAAEAPGSAAKPPPVEYYKLVPGFMAETKNARGQAIGTGFATSNRWGAFTAYLLATNAKGQRTWRIENYLPQGATAQGSTMYLLEGSQRALLVDTAQNTMPEVLGENDLKTVVRHLLSHNNDGSPRPNPLDFVVSNTHNHGDHTGKNSQMSDRAVYFPELDMPNNAPANYVPAKEGGGGNSVGEIALGERTIKVIDIRGHTRGSVGYLDVENRLVMTGDAIGSGFVWMHFGMISQYVESVRHLQELLRPIENPAVLPAHFYQVDLVSRPKPGPVGKQYVDDQVTVAEAILRGEAVGVPYRTVGRAVVIAGYGSAEATYTLSMIAPAEAANVGAYHTIQIPGTSSPTGTNGIDGIKSDFFLIRDRANNSLYLIKGSTKALLVGTGSGAPGLSALVTRLAGSVPVEVIVTSDDAGQIGGLAPFGSQTIYVPRGATIPRTGLRSVTEVGAGDVIQLGQDTAGRALAIQVVPLPGHSATGLTLLDASDRLLLSGDALGMQAGDNGLLLRSSLADFAVALKTWREQTDGKYDLVYTSRNFEWQTTPAFVDQIQSAVDRGLAEGDAAAINSTALPGRRILRGAGTAVAGPGGAAPRGGRGAQDSAASIVLP